MPIDCRAIVRVSAILSMHVSLRKDVDVADEELLGIAHGLPYISVASSCHKYYAQCVKKTTPDAVAQLLCMLLPGMTLLGTSIRKPSATARLQSYMLCVQLPHMTPYYNFIRKPAADFGWDWAPNFTPAGIYGKPFLFAYNHAYLAGGYSKPANSNLHGLGVSPVVL